MGIASAFQDFVQEVQEVRDFVQEVRDFVQHVQEVRDFVQEVRDFVQHVREVREVRVFGLAYRFL